MKSYPGVLAAACAAGLCLAAETPAPDAPVISDGPNSVSVADVRGALTRVPEQYRGEVMMNRDHVATLIDQIYVARVLAGRARKDGLDQDPAVRQRLIQIQDDLLAQLYLKKFQGQAVPESLEKRARELYDANPSSYAISPQANVERIMIDLKGRTREMARQRADEAYAAATSGKQEFLEVALHYTDETNRSGGMRGDLGWVAESTFAPAQRDALAKLAKGQVTTPIETDSGYVLLKLIDRKPGEVTPFAAIKDKIIAAEKDRLAKERVEALMRDIRSSPTAKVDTANVNALVIPFDEKTVQEKPDGDQKVQVKPEAAKKVQEKPQEKSK